MAIKLETIKCKYDNEMPCIKWGACVHDTLLTCLRFALADTTCQLESLKHRQMLKTNLNTEKWRNSTFYFKRRSKQLEAYIVQNGLIVPLAKKESPEDGMGDVEVKNEGA